MVMAKDPAILFYTGDFLNGCVSLTMEERGQYITMLCLQHQSGHLSEKTIRLSVGSVSVDVLNKFEVDENGLYFNRRLDEEIAKRAQYLDTRRVNGKKGGRPKKSEKPYAKPYAKPYGKANENHSENENINEIKDNIILNNAQISILTFDEFWELYDKKVGDKTKIKKKFESINETERQKIIEHLPLYKESTPDKKFRKDPQTYINNKSWNDEIIQSHGTGRKNNQRQPTQQELADLTSVVAKHFPNRN